MDTFLPHREHLRIIGASRIFPKARVAEQADAADSKSADLTVIGVRFSSRAPSNDAILYFSPSCAKINFKNISDNSPTLKFFQEDGKASFYKRKLADSIIWDAKIRRKGYPAQMRSFDGEKFKRTKEISFLMTYSSGESPQL